MYHVCFRLVQIEMFSMSRLASCVSDSIDIWTVAVKNIRNMHAVLTNQITDILHFNDNKY